MNINRREFLHLSLIAAVSCSRVAKGGPEQALENIYNFPTNGDVRILHTTDSHAQLLPVYFREPDINLGFGENLNRPPHLVGKAFLDHFNIPENSPEAHLFTYLNFTEEAKKYSKVGGYEYIATLIKKLRSDIGAERCMLIDGGDSLQGSGTAYWTKGQDMIGAMNLLKVDAMTGHWEFTYEEEQIRKNIADFNGDFIAQNVFLTEEAQFDEIEAYDEDTGQVFPGYKIKEMNGHRVCVIGQAFPYTPIANPQRFIPNWTFGIRESELNSLVSKVKKTESPDVVILLSHNGMDVDLKVASMVPGIDIIMGGHTHDGIPAAIPIKNSGGVTHVTNGGSHGKFVGCFDLKIKNNSLDDFEYRLLPVFPSILSSDKEMSEYITKVRAPYVSKLNKKLGVSNELLYRRGNFSGTSDQVICNALRKQLDADISLSPGFRWGSTILPGQDILIEDVMNLTGMTYPETYVREMSGEELKLILEDVADNLFNSDPYLQQGGDMVRVGGLNYTLNPTAEFGKRISTLTLDDGSIVEANKKYKVAGWSTVGSQSDGPPIWDVVSDYIMDMQTVTLEKFNQPKLVGIKDNLGIAT